jgi:uncharacterized membrane protein YeaQ/YmgE (transglycosylase-associated protein family)
MPMRFMGVGYIKPGASHRASVESGIPYAQQYRVAATAVPTTQLEEKMNFLGWILFGLVVGAIAKFLMPGRDPGGWIVTILLGIAGSFVGGFLATTLMGREQNAAGWIGSIIGAIVLLFIYRLIVGRRHA